jgi:putative hydrolase of the HAD superfamily
MPIRAVLFDRDDVLVRLDRTGIAAELVARLPVDEREVLRRWKAWMEGVPPADTATERHAVRAFLGALAADLGPRAGDELRHAVERFDYTRFVAAYPDARQALVSARRHGLRTGVLSNNDAWLSPRGLLAVTGLDSYVDVVLTAQSIGASKPAPRAYTAAAQALGVATRDCVFLDDTATWVQAARTTGMRAYHVDRTRTAHDLGRGLLCDLSGLESILDEHGARAA